MGGSGIYGWGTSGVYPSINTGRKGGAMKRVLFVYICTIMACVSVHALDDNALRDSLFRIYHSMPADTTRTLFLHKVFTQNIDKDWSAELLDTALVLAAESFHVMLMRPCLLYFSQPSRSVRSVPFSKPRPHSAAPLQLLKPAANLLLPLNTFAWLLWSMLAESASGLSHRIAF